MTREARLFIRVWSLGTVVSETPHGRESARLQRFIEAAHRAIDCTQRDSESCSARRPLPPAAVMQAARLKRATHDHRPLIPAWTGPAGDEAQDAAAQEPTVRGAQSRVACPSSPSSPSSHPPPPCNLSHLEPSQHTLVPPVGSGALAAWVGLERAFPFLASPAEQSPSTPARLGLAPTVHFPSQRTWPLRSQSTHLISSP